MSKPLPLSLALALLAFSCATDFGQGPLTVEPVIGKVEFRIAEIHRSDGASPFVGIEMRSEQIFGCINYGILHTLRQNGSDLHLSIQGATIGPICATALGPATAVNFADLPVGAYSMRLEMNGQTDRYGITVTSKAIHLVPIDAGISRPMERLVWRYPRQSFAILGGTLAGDEWLVMALVDSLRKRIPVQEIHAPPDGRWPFARSVAGYARPAEPRYFLYQHDVDFESAGALLKEFSERYLKNRSGAGIWLENWKRQYYYSWRLINQ